MDYEKDIDNLLEIFAQLEWNDKVFYSRNECLNILTRLSDVSSEHAYQIEAWVRQYDALQEELEDIESEAEDLRNINAHLEKDIAELKEKYESQTS